MLPAFKLHKHKILASVLSIAFALIWAFGLYCFVSFDTPTAKVTGFFVALGGSFGSTWFQLIERNSQQKGKTHNNTSENSQVLTKKQNAILITCVWLFALVLFKFMFDARAFPGAFVMITTQYLGTILAGLISKES